MCEPEGLEVARGGAASSEFTIHGEQDPRFKDVLDAAQRKTRVGHATPVAERGVFRREAGLADARLRAAGGLVRGELDALWRRLHDGVAARRG